MTARPVRPDVVDDLRQSRDELARIYARAQQSYEQGRAAFDGPAKDRHAYLSAYLEAAHAHMVGEEVAREALRGTLGRPRIREPWRRDEAERLFDDALREFAYHHKCFPSDVEHVRDWIRQFGRPAPQRPEAEAER